MTRATMQARKRLRALERAREAVQVARDRGDDPWAITALELREQRLAQSAADAEDAYDDRLGPEPRGPAPRWLGR